MPSKTQEEETIMAISNQSKDHNPTSNPFTQKAKKLSKYCHKPQCHMEKITMLTDNYTYCPLPRKEAIISKCAREDSVLHDTTIQQNLSNTIIVWPSGQA